MLPAHRKIVVVAGIVVLVVAAAGCARTTSTGVRRIELIASDRSGSADAAASPASDSTVGAQLDDNAASDDASVTDEAVEQAASPLVRASKGAALSSLSGEAKRGSAGESSAASADHDDAGISDDEQFMTLVAAAIGAGDLCALWETLELVPLDARAPSSLAKQMQLVTEIMDWSAKIVPPTLVDDWQSVADGFDSVAGLLADGRTSDAIEAYDDPRFVGAQGEIAGWVKSSCD